MGTGAFGGNDEKVLKLTVGVVVKFCEYTKNYCIVNLQYKDYISIQCYKIEWEERGKNSNRKGPGAT